MKRLVPIVATMAAVAFVAGCSGATAPVAQTAAPREMASKRTVSQAITAAMASCGLFPGDAGVVLGTKVALALSSQPHGKPTDVDAVTVRCTLSALGLPSKIGAVFDATMAGGGFQTMQWERWNVQEHVADTLHFEVDVFSTGG